MRGLRGDKFGGTFAISTQGPLRFVPGFCTPKESFDLPQCACLCGLLLLVAGLVVLLEQVLAEVARDVTPYRVDMIRVVLRIIQFN